MPELQRQPVYPWGPLQRPNESALNVSDAAEVTPLNIALDAWAGDHLDAAIALLAIVGEYAKTVGYRQIGKAIAHLELPEHPA